jgi:hypothetical protein
MSWLLERVDPRWLLGTGFVLMAVGQLWAAALPVDDTTLTALVVRIGLVGIGFALGVISTTPPVTSCAAPLPCSPRC